MGYNETLAVNFILLGLYVKEFTDYETTLDFMSSYTFDDAKHIQMNHPEFLL
ncbi:hypothetical protein bthur0014_59870 [Bacillus thuringiensis IBL 4222]|nr:hypothetical protein bthur0014_59870 [Bacillus thuringiensis IBL 4222]